METPPFTAASFEDFLNQKRLMGTRCLACGAVYLPPRALCRKCYQANMEWVEMPGRGKLAAFTCIYVAPSFMGVEGFDRNHPYCAGVVALENGVSICARIVGVEAKEPASIHIGMPLTVEFRERAEGEAGRIFLAFRAC